MADATALRITEECINCGACEPECPRHAISALEAEDLFAIDAAKCDGCVDAGQGPLCVSVCPVECIVPAHKPAAPPGPEVPAGRGDAPAMTWGLNDGAAPRPADDLFASDEDVQRVRAAATPAADPASALRMVRVLWGALALGTAVLPVVGAFLVPAFGEASGLFWLWAGLGAILTVASLLVPAWVIRGGVRQLELAVETLPLPAGESMFREPAPSRRRFVGSQAAWSQAVPVFQRAMICGMAVAEAVALLGVVSLLTAGGWSAAVGFFVAAGALQLFHLPTVRRARSALEAAYDAKLEL